MVYFTDGKTWCEFYRFDLSSLTLKKYDEEEDYYENQS